jgi:hypothetical protein
LAVARAADRINAQRSATDAIDAKALGAIALDGAGIATLAALSGTLDYWWAGAGIMGLSAVILGYAVWPRRLDVGPEPELFHARFGGNTAYDYHAQMLVDLSDAISRNDVEAPRLVFAFEVGSVLLALGIVVAVIAAIAHHH